METGENSIMMATHTASRLAGREGGGGVPPQK
jgi:hypothetical protein